MKWIILLSIVPVIVSTEMMWLSLAPIASLAEEYYGVGSMAVTLCSMSFMIMFILFSLPASWVIDRWGYKASLLIGAGLTAVFGLLRALFADDFTLVLIFQFILAIGQPFLLNIATKVASDWFPLQERSTAAGILTLAQYIGFIVPMALAPAIAKAAGIPELFMWFAVFAIAASCLAAAFVPVKPPAPLTHAAPHQEVLRFESIRLLMTNKNYFLILFISFISIGIFNTILTLLETILTPRGFSSEEAGLVGAVFIVAGIIGAVVLPILSDKYRIRAPFFIAAITLLIPAYLGLTFAEQTFPVAVIAGLAGFTIMGVAPILFQHGSELAYPVQEGTSLGMILLMGQVSGIAFVYLFELLNDALDSIVWPMLLFVLLTAILLPVTLRIQESSLRAPAPKDGDKNQPM
ncbi:MFS transporter, FLVCR family, MFS-domain-containing protein 7 [Paenibacillus catalpae]|uniref:MFS transporter, FLVCR family, MFS-domain-containing protein 7 n=1 Tax=Paenibacillus catalpae TaxID=1045775 RepID=A0A1I2BL26_9BACL|nr:MFS transporter [Paenibacillus catalpae]SFE56924.1 MFS transporter, FLVCR family, MFS-domain-containing protein 7 [Paenibacillus catalpae]